MTRTAKRLPRFRRDPGAIRSMELTRRDKEVIRLVSRFRFLRSSQVLRLVDGAPAQLLRRLQALYHHGWLDRPRCQIDFFHHGGSRPMVYGLAARGASLMRREFDVPFGRLVWSRGGEYVGRLFLEHTLMVAEILIAVEIACRERGSDIRFLSGDELAAGSAKTEPFHWSATLNGRRVGLVPDGVYALEVTGKMGATERIVCLLEADRGTMPVTRRSPHLSCIARKLSAYSALWKSGAFAKRFGTNRLAVILVTTSEARTKTIREAVDALPSGRGLFACHALDEVIADPQLLLR